jgi:NADPH:quinone reductase-like Zn-dependent oxidoreductase
VFERFASEVRVRIDGTSEQVQALGGYEPYSVGRLATTGTTRVDPVTVLVRGRHQVDSEVKVSSADVVALSRSLDVSSAVLVPPVAAALALWETLNLELGEAAVWTGGSPLSGLVGQVALWRGACPAVELGSTESNGGAEGRQGIEVIDWTDAESASAKLTEVAADKPGFAAIDLSGRADVIDSLLEAIPRWGRLILAGPPGSNLTIDFYKNVHRKGIIISSTILEPAAIFETSRPEVLSQVPRAIEVLSNPVMANQCKRLLGLSIPRAAVRWPADTACIA